MDYQASEKELSADICVTCGGKLTKDEGRFAGSDIACCPACSEELKLEPSSDEGEWTNRILQLQKIKGAGFPAPDQ